MKWTTLTAAVVALGINSVATAGMMPMPCKSQNVSIPCEKNAWHLLAEGLYLQPSNDDLDYFENFQPTPQTRHAVEPKHRFGFRAEAGYQFDAGNDLTASWMHFGRTFHELLTTEGDNTQNNLDANAKFDLDKIDLEFGQHFDLGTNGDLRLHFGGQYLKLESHLMIERETFVGTQSPGLARNKYLSEFTGLGPRAGADWTYHLSSGFDIVSRAALSLLVGDLKTEWKRSQFDPQTPAWQPFVDKNTRRTVVPTAEGRFGLRWTHLADSLALSVEGGYHALGVFQSVHFLGADPDSRARPHQFVSNYGHHGPYLNVALTI